MNENTGGGFGILIIFFHKKEFYSIEDLNNDIYYNYITLFNGTLINRDF